MREPSPGDGLRGQDLNLRPSGTMNPTDRTCAGHVPRYRKWQRYPNARRSAESLRNSTVAIACLRRRPSPLESRAHHLAPGRAPAACARACRWRWTSRRSLPASHTTCPAHPSPPSRFRARNEREIDARHVVEWRYPVFDRGPFFGRWLHYDVIGVPWSEPRSGGGSSCAPRGGVRSASRSGNGNRGGPAFGTTS